MASPGFVKFRSALDKARGIKKKPADDEDETTSSVDDGDEMDEKPGLSVTMVVGRLPKRKAMAESLRQAGQEYGSADGTRRRGIAPSFLRKMTMMK